MTTTGEVHPSLPHHPSNSLPDGAGLRGQVERLVRDSVPNGAVVSARLAGSCVDAFLAHHGDPRTAAQAVAAECTHFGELQTVHGLSDDDLTVALRAIGRGLRRHVMPVLLRQLDQLDSEALSRSVQEYLMRILGHIRQGMQTMQRFHALAPERRRHALSRAAFGAGDVRTLRGFALACGLDPAVRLTPVVATDPDATLGLALRDRDDVLAGTAPGEGAVPATWTNDQVRRRSGVDVARGPVVPLVELPEAARLTRTTAAVAAPGVPVTQTRDVLTQVMVHGSPLLADLVTGSRLGPFLELPAVRRAALGRTVLDWLEHGTPVNVLARQTGTPAQTIHTRLATAKRMLDDPLTDPDRRLELLVALRLAVPGWEAEVQSA